MAERGMKKWAPYRSLPEHDPALLAMKKARHKVDKPTLLEDEQNRINNILLNYKGEEITITYYDNGDIITVTTTIKKIDKENRRLILADSLKINFKNLINII